MSKYVPLKHLLISKKLFPCLGRLKVQGALKKCNYFNSLSFAHFLHKKLKTRDIFRHIVGLFLKVKETSCSLHVYYDTHFCRNMLSCACRNFGPLFAMCRWLLQLHNLSRSAKISLHLRSVGINLPFCCSPELHIKCN